MASMCGFNLVAVPTLQSFSLSQEQRGTHPFRQQLFIPLSFPPEVARKWKGGPNQHFNYQLTWPNNQLTWPNNQLTWPNNQLTWPNNQLTLLNNQLALLNNQLAWPDNQLAWHSCQLYVCCLTISLKPRSTSDTYPRTDLNRDKILAAITKGISWSQLAKKKKAERYLMHQISMVNHGIHYCHWAYISCTMILKPNNWCIRIQCCVAPFSVLSVSCM